MQSWAFLFFWGKNYVPILGWQEEVSPFLSATDTCFPRGGSRASSGCALWGLGLPSIPAGQGRLRQRYIARRKMRMHFSRSQVSFAATHSRFYILRQLINNTNKPFYFLLIVPQYHPIFFLFGDVDVLGELEVAVFASVCFGDGEFVGVSNWFAFFLHFPVRFLFATVYFVGECFSAEVADEGVCSILYVASFFESLVHRFVQ